MMVGERRDNSGAPANETSEADTEIEDEYPF